MNVKLVWSGFVALSCSLLPAEDHSRLHDLLPQQPLPADARPVTDLHELMRSGALRNGRTEDKLATNEDETTRGFSEDVYPLIAPAVVVVQNHYCHGTGFFIRDSGWLLTNNHVVEDCDYDAELGGQVAMINFGTLNDDGWMEVSDQPLRAVVYKTDVRQDLALLKLVELPSGMEQVPVIPFAKSIPRPGAGVVAVGHPAAGTLWTLRSGEMAGAGIFPDDQMDRIIFLLSISSGDRKFFEESLRQDPERKQVVLSTCGLNPGDSGGPLVNADGELVAVSYAVPTIDLDSQVDRGKFSFHIHLKEIDDFLSLWPDEPIMAAPNPRAAGMYSSFQDQDGDGRYDALAIANDPAAEPIGVLIDFDQDSFGGQTIEQLANSGTEPFPGDFDYEFAICMAPRSRISYDTDNDGTIDLVFSDEDHDDEPETALRYVDRGWTIAPLEGEVLAAEHFSDVVLRKRFKTWNAAQSGSADKSGKANKAP
jgi:S1-C subfamily serine protease